VGGPAVDVVLLGAAALVPAALAVPGPLAVLGLLAVAARGVDLALLVVRVRVVILDPEHALLLLPQTAHDPPARALGVDSGATDAGMLLVLVDAGRRPVAHRLDHLKAAVSLLGGVGRRLRGASYRRVCGGISRRVRGGFGRGVGGSVGRGRGRVQDDWAVSAKAHLLFLLPLASPRVLARALALNEGTVIG